MEADSRLTLPFLTRDMLAFEHGTTFSLGITARTEITNVIHIRGFTREGPFSFKVNVTGDSAFASTTFRIPDFPILVTLTHEDESGTANATYAMLDLRINGTRYAILAQGHIGPHFGLTWPSQPTLAPLQNRGHFEHIGPANPAAGAEFVLDTDAEVWTVLHSISLRYTAAAAAATRRVALSIRVNPGNPVLIPSPGDIVISETWDLCWMLGGTSSNDTTGKRQLAPLPSGLLIPPSSRIETLTTAKNAADQISDVEIFLERYQDF